MTIRKTHHTTYNTNYRLVWAPKRRRYIQSHRVRSEIDAVIHEAALNHNMTIDEMEVSGDHVHVFLSFPL